jgi:octaheme c-type cytochrome (tetrathionate reductase family)
MSRKRWMFTLTAAALALAALAPLVLQSRGRPASGGDPWARVPAPPPHTAHADLIRDPLADGPAVTRECLRCHPDAAREVMATVHWTWLGEPAVIPGHAEPVRIGKRNLVNNYCIGIQSNWERCTACHAGYGWRDETFEFGEASNVDCLVCHDQTGTYLKDPRNAGLPDSTVDLLAAARSVGRPTRTNCGYCHFQGGGGDAVKHGDLDGTFYFPSDRIDVHMGRYNLQCIDCHRAEHHEMSGRALSVSADHDNRLECSDCHGQTPHANERINEHVHAVACQTCHIPFMAVGAPTKMSWDWSTAGQDREEDPHTYLKIKGSFTYAQHVVPQYFWFDHRSYRYLQGDRIDPDSVTALNRPLGSIDDPDAQIWPFKVHRGRQIYDAVNDYLLVPKTVGPGGYWTEFDWDLAARLGSQATGLAYSGKYGFARTEMFWPITHMVAPADRALQCPDCHGEGGRMDWRALGYDGDPAYARTRRSAGATSAGAAPREETK